MSALNTVYRAPIGLVDILRCITVVGGLAVPVSAGLAQTPDTTIVHELPGLTVTATAPDRQITPPVSVISVDSARLQRTLSTDAYDLVRRSTGIEIHEQGQGPGYASNAVLRGFTSDHSSDVLLLIDGVPINLPIHGHVEGYADWSALSAPALQSLRVIHGPASPEYGDFAFGGVVEAITRSEGNGNAFGVSSSSEGDAGGWFRTGRQGATDGRTLAIEARRGQGWRDNADSWLGTGVVRGWKSTGRGRLEGGVLLYGSTWNSPGFVSVERFNDGALTGALDATDGGDAQRLILHGRYTRSTGENSRAQVLAWTQLVRQSVYLTIPHDGVLAQSRELDRRVAFGGQFQFSQAGVGNGDLSLGVDGRADIARYDRIDTERRTPTDTETANRGRFLSTGAFVRWRSLVGSHLQIDLGARIDLLHYASFDLLDSLPSWRTSTSVQAGPKLGARLLLGGGLTAHGSFSHGFRGAPGVITDPGRPSMGVWASEIGVDLTHDRVRVGVAAFRMAVSNEQVVNPITLEVSDQGGSIRQGLTGEFEAALTRSLWLVGQGVLNDAAITGSSSGNSATASIRLAADSDTAIPYTGGTFRHEEPPSPGDPVPGVSRYTVRGGIEFRGAEEALFGVAGRLIGPYTPLGEPERRTKSYLLVDLSATVPLRFLRATADLELQNLFDRRYPEIRASGFLNPGAPRTVRMALRFPLAR